MDDNSRFLKKCKFFVLFCMLVGCAAQNCSRVGKYWYAGTERPYIIKGVRYVPQTHYQYSAVGVASWYGPGFHKKPTATGRTYDQHGLTAAHRTLPLPSIVVVSNLRNGRKVRLLVNDRGPFAKTDRRIIDVSKKAAILLGFLKKGCARVRVTCLPKESKMAAIMYGRRPYPSYPRGK